MKNLSFLYMPFVWKSEKLPFEGVKEEADAAGLEAEDTGISGL